MKKMLVSLIKPTLFSLMAASALNVQASEEWVEIESEDFNPPIQEQHSDSRSSTVYDDNQDGVADRQVINMPPFNVYSNDAGEVLDSNWE